MKKVVVVILVFCCLLMTACNGKGDKAENNLDGSYNESDFVNTEPFYIETPYCNLAIPSEYNGKIETEILSDEPYAIAFISSKEKQHLFTLYFEKETEELIGTLPLKTENIVLYVDFGKLDLNGENYEDLMGYQNSINTIIDYLIKDYGLLVDEIVLDEKEDVFEINTDVVTLHYPSKWKSVVDVENEGDVVKFTSSGVRLFDIYLKECNGDLLGFYKDNPIYIISYTFNYGDLSEEEYDNLCAMQQDVNVIINHLLEDKNFVK